MGRRNRRALLALLVVASCSGTKHASTVAQPSTTTIKANSAAACAFITQKDATKLFGAPARRANLNDTSGAVSSCAWHGTNKALLSIKIYNDEAHYGEQYVDNPQRLNGIGDRAYVRAQTGIGTVDLQFIRNGKTYAFTYAGGANAKTQLIALVRKNAKHR